MCGYNIFQLVVQNKYKNIFRILIQVHFLFLYRSCVSFSYQTISFFIYLAISLAFKIKSGDTLGQKLNFTCFFGHDSEAAGVYTNLITIIHCITLVIYLLYILSYLYVIDS